jgi:hypothetical protein
MQRAIAAAAQPPYTTPSLQPSLALRTLHRCSHRSPSMQPCLLQPANCTFAEPTANEMTAVMAMLWPS